MNKQHHEPASTPAAMPAEHARELAIVAMLLAASIAATWLEAHQLAASLGGAAVALILPRVPTPGRAALVLGAVGLAMALEGCGGAPVPARSACVAAARTLELACQAVPAELTLGGEEEPPP